MAKDFDSVKDSGERRDFGTGAVRDCASGKGRYDLLPVFALRRLARHFENGAKKYGDNNWRAGIPLNSFFDSAIRHAFNYWAGQDDEDHLCAAIWNLCCLLETEQLIENGKLPKSLNTRPESIDKSENDNE